jgi:hypothetical protein
VVQTEALVRQKWRLLKATMNERARRLWAGAEAGAIGYGGVAAVSRASGMAISTVRKGRDEARAGARLEDVDWRGRPLRTYETIINLVGSPSNGAGLVVRARLDHRRYPTGKKVSAKELRALEFERDDFHGDWNYVIHPRKHMG